MLIYTQNDRKSLRYDGTECEGHSCKTTTTALCYPICPMAIEPLARARTEQLTLVIRSPSSRRDRGIFSEKEKRVRFRVQILYSSRIYILIVCNDEHG